MKALNGKPRYATHSDPGISCNVSLTMSCQCSCSARVIHTHLTETIGCPSKFQTRYGVPPFESPAMEPHGMRQLTLRCVVRLVAHNAQEMSVRSRASAKRQNSFRFPPVLLVFLVPGNLERELSRKITTFCKVQIRVGLGWA